MKRTALKRKSWLKRGTKRLKKKSKTRDPLTILHEKARAVFAKWIVKRDKNICFTCGKYGNQCGHFVHGKAMDFSEKGNHCQCASCNFFRSGNLIVYAIKLEAKYGYGIVQKLKAEGDKIKRWKRKELERIIKKYKE